MKRPSAGEQALFASATPQSRAEYDALVVQVASLLMRVAATGAKGGVRQLARTFAEDVAKCSSVP